MAIGERIHFFRNLRGMTQKHFGQLLGFPEKSADVRLAQYETGARTPKADLTAAMAQILDVSPNALTVPDIDSYIGLMHTLFTMEDLYGLHPDMTDGVLNLRLDKSKGNTYITMFDMIYSWQQQLQKLESGEITKEEYDRWRYHYPEFDKTKLWAKVPSKEFSDALVKASKK